jgi:hypothetical protein
MKWLLGIIDHVRMGFDGWETAASGAVIHVDKTKNHYVNKFDSGPGKPNALKIVRPKDTYIDNFYQSFGVDGVDWKGRYVHGANSNFSAGKNWRHLDSVFKKDILHWPTTIKAVHANAAVKYRERVEKSKRLLTFVY